MEKLYTVIETAKHLKISRAKLYQLIEKGVLTPIKLDKRTLFPEGEITAFIETLKKKKPQ